MTESWERELARIREKKKRDKEAQAEAQKIEGELPEIRDWGSVAIMIPSRRRKKKGDEKS